MSPNSQWPLVDQWIANYKAHKASIGLAPPSSPVSDAVAQASGPDGIAYRAGLEDEFDEESLDPDSAMSEEEELDQKRVRWPTFPEVHHQTPSITALMQMPVHRLSAVLPDMLFTLTEVSNQPNHDEAAVGYCVGRVADTPCGGCVNGIGPFALCVTVPGFFGNACVGCHWAGSATPCSANVQERARTTENDGDDMPEGVRVSEQDNMATPTEIVNTKTLENHLASREHLLPKTMDMPGETFEARLTKIENLLEKTGLAQQDRPMLTEANLMAGLTKFEDSLLDRMKAEMNEMVTVEAFEARFAKLEAALMDVKVEQANMKASMQKIKDKIFSGQVKLRRLKTLTTRSARVKAVLAETQAEQHKVATPDARQQRVEAIETRCAGLEGLVSDVKAEQEMLKQDVALEVDTMKAAIAHSHQESPQMFEVDGNFYLTRPKAVAVMLAAQCILWDLESS